MTLIFTIEGNIGVGKTTLINTLRNTTEIERNEKSYF